MDKIRPVIGGVALLLSSCAPTAAAPAQSRPAFAALSHTIDDVAADKALPSVVAVVFDEHRILWSHVSGRVDLEDPRPPTLDSRYRVGSMAKAVTATVLAIAEQAGLVPLDTPVPVTTAEGSITVTLRQALNMQAGLAQAVCYQGINGDIDQACGPDFDLRFTVAITGGKGRYSYSNMGPQLAAKRLSHILQEPFEDTARRLLFRPAGMDEATYDHARPTRDRAASYDQTGKPYPYDFTILPAAGAGLEASARDLVRFGQLHLSGRVPGGRRLLTQSARALLHSAPNGFYGYGWGRIGAGKPTEVLISDGQVNGGQAMMLLNPVHKVGAIVLSNAANDAISELAIAAIDAAVPGTAAAFAADVAAMQKAHEATLEALLPSPDFNAAGFVRVGDTRLPLTVESKSNRLAVTLAGQTIETSNASTDEGFRVWRMPCPSQVPACSRPGATAKIFMSREPGGFGGQLQVTSHNGQFPYGLRLRLH